MTNTEEDTAGKKEERETGDMKGFQMNFLYSMQTLTTSW